MEYPFIDIEKKWQKTWLDEKVFFGRDFDKKPKFYVLNMFPYPSGSLHMGHVSNYSIGDAIGRIKLMQGYNVMNPIGYDAFGMPAENFAIEHNTHPRLTTEKNITNINRQFHAMGFGFDWPRELSTHRPDYYRWGQWLFKRFYEKGLAYKKKSYVNWCDSCQTVLANEQVEDGKCWRCGCEVKQKEMEQWFFKITDYADQLLDFSDMIDWPDRVKTMQTNWIGKSLGTEVNFALEDGAGIIPVFTTRPDTLYGVTFMALPPEHPLVQGWLKDNPDPALVAFCEKVINADKITRTAEDTAKEGFFTGHYCLNPLTGAKVQIWVTNYVLMDYGTGAVMAVPAHDQRDWDFASRYDIPKILVIQNKDNDLDLNTMTCAYTEPGTMVNSAEFNGLPSPQAKGGITAKLERENLGRGTISYRLRDWGVSRQRYWGNPIPIIYCPKCGTVLVPDEELPVQLPENVQVGKTTQNPLLSVSEWLNVKCPQCGGPARRETDTMDTFVDSSWYFARYADPFNTNLPYDKAKADYWLPVDHYIGGIEHACMHLLYARFFHKFMRDLGLVSGNEPFARLLTQGMVTKDGAKMSKSKGNVVDPQGYIDRFGSDTVRVFMLFASPPEKDVEWSDTGVIGCFRFLNRVWRLFDDNLAIISQYHQKPEPAEAGELSELRWSTHHTVKKALDDVLNRLQYNTAIAANMEHLNRCLAIKDPNLLNNQEKIVFAQACAIIPRLLYPFAPHLAEELWQRIGHKHFIHEAGMPAFEEKYLIKDEIVYVIQVNGKVRGRLSVAATAAEEDIIAAAMAEPNVAKFIADKTVKNVRVIAGKLVSLVIA